MSSVTFFQIRLLDGGSIQVFDFSLPHSITPCMIILSFGFAVFSVQVFVSPQGITDWMVAFSVQLESLMMLLYKPEPFE